MTYYNRSQEDINAKLEEYKTHPQFKEDPYYANRQLVIYIVKEWESEYELTDADIKAMEADRPGMVEIIFIWYPHGSPG